MRIELFPNALKIMKGIICLTMFMLLVTVAVNAQDTLKKKTINITSTFKPALKNTSKLNFNAEAPLIDTSRPDLKYNLPTQFLSLTYQPNGLNPVALPADSIKTWNNDNYIKVGAGNIHLPYVLAGLSFGDRKKSFFNISAEGYSSKGKLPYQENSLLAASISGTIKSNNNLEWDGALGFRADGYYLYGFQPDTLKFVKSQLQQQFFTFDGRIGLRNTVPSSYGLTYNPNIKIAAFGLNNSPRTSEADMVFNVPVEKILNEHFAIDLAFTADITNYSYRGASAINNNLFIVSPAVIYHSDNIALHLEMTPTWDQSDFHLLPNFRAEYTTDDKRFTLFASLDGYYDKGSFKRFAGINPWLWEPTSLLNTRVNEFFGGFKGSLSNHISYLAKAGFSQSHNMPLFLNDSLDGKNFQVVYEERLDDFNVHGEISYIEGEDLNITAGLTLNNYKTKSQYRAWGLLPFEFTTSFRWQPIKDLWLKADLLAFEGGYFRNVNNIVASTTGGFDVNAGVEFRIARQVNLWLQMNNLFNDKYQRWNQYSVYGFNILGGVIFTFGR
ncbi:MAG TPA: hypothetical protein VFI33_18495 [Puia sp.]|nr:hypothetical protein [Puia sp.]